MAEIQFSLYSLHFVFLYFYCIVWVPEPCSAFQTLVASEATVTTAQHMLSSLALNIAAHNMYFIYTVH